MDRQGIRATRLAGQASRHHYREKTAGALGQWTLAQRPGHRVRGRHRRFPPPAGGARREPSTGVGAGPVLPAGREVQQRR